MEVENSSQLRISKRVSYFGRSTMKKSFEILSALPLLVASYCVIAGSPQLKTVEVNGTELAYIEQGEGAPVVFVHGANVDYRYWEPQREAIAERYHFIAYSLRYHEPNRWQDGGEHYSVQTHVADLVAFIQSLNVGPVHLVGLSYGGAIAANLALDHPELVKTLTLADGSVVSLIADLPEARPVLAQRSTVMAEAKEVIKTRGPREGLKVFMDWILDAKGAYDNDPGINRGMYEDNLKTLVPLLASPPPPRIDCAKAGTITAPTLILAGERTHPYYRMIDAAWARCVPGSESATIPGADHPMSIRNPAAFNEALLTFFARHE